MSRRRFFYVFSVNGRLSSAIYEDDLPTKHMTDEILGKVVYRTELTGKWLTMSLTEIMAEYRKRAAAGAVPTSNITNPPKEKKETRTSHEIKYLGTGDFWMNFHRQRGTAK